MSAEELVRHLLLQEGKDVLWSIPVEFKYYFVLPVVALVLVLLLRKSAWLAVPAVAAAIAATLWFRPPEASVPADLHVVYYLPIFLLGQLAALLHWHMHRWLKADAWFHRGMEVLACGCLALLIATIPSVYTKLTGAEFIWYQRFQKDFLFFGLAWPGLGWLCARNN
jgi:peptidoglycan/LPS O-acetylase OafA/YrhL